MAYVDIVFDGLPSNEPGRFVEVENERGESIRFGKWMQRPDGYWVLRIEGTQMPTPYQHDAYETTPPPVGLPQYNQVNMSIYSVRPRRRDL